MQRYFLNEKYVDQKQSFILTGEDYHHAVRVMRMEIGDDCFLVFQDQYAIKAKITRIEADGVYLEEIEKEQSEKEMPVSVTIACGYPKGDKLEWIAQKGTELGMQALVGFPSKYAVAKWDDKKRVKKGARLQKICKEAAEQAHRTVQPLVTLHGELNELVLKFKEYQTVLVAYEESAKEGEKLAFVQAITQCVKQEKVLVIFGPEGGFSKEEIDLFCRNGAIICGLGPRILRAETAPLYVLSAMSYQWELLG